MKIKLTKDYQGWAAKELGGLPSEYVEKGEHEVTDEFGQYLLETFSSLAEVVEEVPEDVKEAADPPKTRKRVKKATG